MTANNEEEPIFNPLRHKLREWEVTDADGNVHKVLMTDHWTVVPLHWSASWLLDVWKAEREVGHAICGWPTLNHKPCKNYPIADEAIANVTMVGKCGLHANPPVVVEPKEMQVKEIHGEMIPVDEAGLPTVPSFKAFSDIAMNIYTRCANCEYRFRCDKEGQNDGICIKQHTLFNELMGDVVRQYSLTEAVDQMIAFNMISSFIDIIKTHLYESHHGTESAMKEGMFGLRLQLNRLIQQNMRTLGVDRKFRIVIRRGNDRQLSDRTLAELMADKSVGEIHSATQTTTVTSYKKVPEPKKHSFIDIDGKPIVDIEYEVET